jgi:hypothetical protein
MDASDRSGDSRGVDIALNAQILMFAANLPI